MPEIVITMQIGAERHSVQLELDDGKERDAPRSAADFLDEILLCALNGGEGPLVRGPWWTMPVDDPELARLRAIEGAAHALAEAAAREHADSAYGLAETLDRLKDMRALLRRARTDCSRCRGTGAVVVETGHEGGPLSFKPRRPPTWNACDCTREVQP